MTQEEAINYFLQKKQSEGISNSSIRTTLKSDYQFSDDQIKEILTEISDQELTNLQQNKKGALSFLESKYMSYFFVIFGIVAIVVSILYTQKETEDDLQRFLPWVMILGASFLIYKHGYRIFKQ